MEKVARSYHPNSLRPTCISQAGPIKLNGKVNSYAV